jgi:hypothetical protein
VQRMDHRELEKILVRRNKTIDAERAAAASGSWNEYLALRWPPPSRLKFLEHRDWRAAYDRAVQIGVSAATRGVLVFPAWWCDNDTEDSSGAWSGISVALFEDETYEVIEKKLGSVIIAASVEVMRLGFISPSAWYSPSVPVAYRNSHFVTLDSTQIERVVAIDREIPAAPVAKPTRKVEPFVTEAESAVALTRVPPAERSRIEAAIARLRVRPSTD